MALVVTVFAVIGFLLLRSHAAPTPPTVYLSPSSQTFPVNTSFTVQVRENSGATGVNAVQANFSYPATLVDFVSIDFTGSAFGTQASSSGANGAVSIGAGVSGAQGPTGITGDQLIATVTFKTKAAGGTANMAFTSGTVLLKASGNTDILGSLAATGGASFLIDTVAPTVSITAPANNATISSGSTVSINVTATDSNSPVSSVQILVDGVVKTTLSSSPYTYSWSTSGVALGSHTIQAKGTDPSGNVGQSAVTTITLADLTAPTTSITSPTANAKLKGTNNITATATDNTGGTGVSKVEFYVDGVLKGTVLVSPYTFAWNTATSTDGNHSLTVKAYDNATPANVATSAAVAVSTDNTAPTAPTGLQASATTQTSISLTWAASTDNVGVSNYRVTRNSVTIATIPTTSYNDTGLTAGTSYTYAVTALDAVGNVSTAATLVTSTSPAVLGDLNGDGHVDITDLSILLSKWSTADATADINQDGSVNIFDLSILLSHYGT